MKCVIMGKREEFNRWFKQFLTQINQSEDSGIACLMICIPLLERYLREKSKIFEQVSVDSDNFWDALIHVFGTDSIATRDHAKAFWKTVRHGIMHQAAPSLQQQRNVDITKVIFKPNAKPVEFTDNDKTLILDKDKIVPLIIDTIENDFPAFEASGSKHHKFPDVVINPLTGSKSTSGYAGRPNVPPMGSNVGIGTSSSRIPPI